MRRAALLVTVVLTTVACAGSQYDSHYSVVIDSSFTPEEMSLTVAALQQWEDATTLTAMPVSFTITTDGSCTPEAGEAKICIHRSTVGFLDAKADNTTSLGLTNWDRHDDASNVWISPIDTSNQSGWSLFQVTTAHELGHAMGLHHTGAGSLMCWEVGCVSDAVTKTDVSQYLELRGVSR